MPPGTISIAVAITLEEAGIPYEAVKLSFRSADQSKPEYLAVNPKARVPALVLDTGQVLTETGAILDYIAALAPDAGMVPNDPAEAAHMRSVMYYLASTMHINHAHKLRGSRWASQQSSFDDMRAMVPQTMTESCAFVENHALEGPFVMGPGLTIADPYLFTICCWLQGDGVDTAPFPRLTTFMTTMESRASIQTVRAKGML